MSSRSNRYIAKRHQSFPAGAVLPGEDPKEFEALFRELRGDLKPSGRVEHLLVADIASLIWRKSRLGVFRVAEAARKEFGECYADGDIEAGALLASARRMEKEQLSVERSMKKTEFLEQMKPKDVALDDAIQKLQSSIQELKKQNGIDPQSSPPLDAESVEQELAKQREADLFAILDDLITPECFMQEIEFKEHLDEAIDRALDRLIEYQARRISGSTVERRRSRQRRFR
jgi:hypothetical protein